MNRIKRLVALVGEAVSIVIAVMLFIVAAGTAIVVLLAIMALIPFGKLKEFWRKE